MMREFFRGWTRNLRVTFVGLGRNLLAAPDDVIPLASFIAALRFYTLLRRDAWFMEYLAGDAHDAILQPMIERVQAQGGLLMMGAEALSLEPGSSGWRVRVEDKRRGGLRTIHARQVILAVDPPAARRLLTASPALADHAARLRFPDALADITVRLWFDSAPTGSAASGMFTGDFPMDNFFWLHRLYDDFKPWHRATGGSAIETHLYGHEGLFDLTDAALLAKVVGELRRVWPALRGHFVHGAVRRNSRTQTLFRVPDAASLAVATAWPGLSAWSGLLAWPGLLACGDWIAHPLPVLNMERSVVTAIEAANHILRAEGREPWPILSPRRPEPLAAALGGVVRGGRWLLGPVVRAVGRPGGQ
jgi:isorenieratene synthase